MKKFKVKTKKGVGKFLRLATPTKSVIIKNGEAELSEEDFKAVQRYVEVVKDKPKSYKTTVTKVSEKKSEEDGDKT
jgi:hypothetical protein